MKIEWKPINDIILEDNALNAIKCDCNCLVNAGPGAGKSELLVQKANYIFTIINPNSHQKLLAISFTRAAASNLRDRINKTFSSKMSKRFVSTTFDAFCLDIYLQFKNVLKESFVIKNSFNIDFNPDKNFYNEFDNFATQSLLDEYKTAPDYRTMIYLPLLNKTLYEISDPFQKELIIQYIKFKISKNELTFEIIKQLAYIILTKNEQIRNCIKITYPFVFIDEFQDTNYIQYQIIKLLFLNSNTLITCVGDKNQSIFSFQGANNQLIYYYVKDFHAAVFYLQNNYRSQSSIVKLVNTLGKQIDTTLVPGISKVKNIKNGVQELIYLNTNYKENIYVYEKIKKLLEEGIKPRDIAIFGKQNIDYLTSDLIQYLNNNGIKTRFEDKYINFIQDDFFKFCFSLVYISLNNDAIFFRNVIEIYQKLYGDDFSYNTIDKDLHLLKDHIIQNSNFFNIIKYIIDYYDLKKYNIFQIITQTSKFETKIKELQNIFIFPYQNPSELLVTITNFYGYDTIPIITIHKSKGLQYDSVFFIGMENSQFYRINKNKEEERVIFVAISRAKRNLFITCGNWRDKYSYYTNQRLNELIDQLEINGLKIIEQLS